MDDLSDKEYMEVITYQHAIISEKDRRTKEAENMKKLLERSKPNKKR